MKAIWISAAASLFIFTSVSFAANETDAQIQKIKTQYSELKKAPLKTKKYDTAYGGESAEGSTSEVSLLNGEIKIIKDEYFGESGKVAYEFYFDQGKPFFILETETNYSLPLMQPVPGLPKPTQTKTEYRYYIQGGKLIRLLEGQKEIAKDNKKFTEKWERTLATSQNSYSGTKEFLDTQKKSK